MKDSFFNRAHLTPHLAFYAGIFVIFLATGMWGGRIIGSSGSFLSSPSRLSDSPKAARVPTIVPATDQRNLLVIGVDQLSASQPELKSAWLVMYFPGKPDFTFLPIYPTPDEQGVKASSNLQTSFSLDTIGRPNPAFLHQLAERIWWTNYLVIDQTAMIALINMVGGVPLNNQYLDGAQIMARMSSSSQDSNETYASQVSLLASICGEAKNLPSKKSIVTTLRKIKTNLTTDLDLIASMDIWLDPNKKSIAVRCEFPLSTTSIP
jgi:hypothetical protein